MLLPGDNLLQNRFRNTVQKGPYSGVQSHKNGNFISSVPLSFNKTHTPGKQYSQLDAEQSFSEAVSNNWRRSMLSTSLSTPSLDLNRAPVGHGQRVLMHNPNESYIEQHEKKLEIMGASAKEVLAQATQSIGDHLSSIMSAALLQLKSDIANRKMYVMFEELLHCDVRTDHTQARSVLPIFEPFIDKAESFLQSSFYHFIKKEVEYYVKDF